MPHIWAIEPTRSTWKMVVAAVAAAVRLFAFLASYLAAGKPPIGICRFMCLDACSLPLMPESNLPKSTKIFNLSDGTMVRGYAKLN